MPQIQSKLTLKHFTIKFILLKLVFCSHQVQNNPQSDVIVTYAGHADAQNDRPYSAPEPRTLPPVPPMITPQHDQENSFKQTEGVNKPDMPTISPPSLQNQIVTEFQNGGRGNEDPSVVFVKNHEDQRIDRDDGYLSNSDVRFANVNDKGERDLNMIKEGKSDETVHEDAFENGRRSVYDIMRNGQVQTESPLDDDVVFVTGRNGPEDEAESFRRRGEDRREDERQQKKKPQRFKINCGRLVCDNTIAAVCAGKLDDNKQWKYRRFMNLCHLTKVNCDFQYDSNRYIRVPSERCVGIADYHQERSQSYQPKPSLESRRLFPIKGANSAHLRSSLSRRSFNINLKGQLCSHPCPVACPDVYEPECAKTEYGTKKVFMNHCVLDKHSCDNNLIWQSQQMTECIGSEKENVRQNRGFIGWMQKVGIIDGKGRLIGE